MAKKGRLVKKSPTSKVIGKGKFVKKAKKKDYTPRKRFV